MAGQDKSKGSSAISRLRAQANQVKATAQASIQASGDMTEFEIPLAKLRFDPRQVRSRYHSLDGRIQEKDQAYIEELAKNINTQGLIQPITVSELPDGTYVVRVGECRTRAHIFLGRETVRAKIKNDLDKRSARLIYQLSENLLRNDLNEWEIATAVKELLAGNPDEGDPPMSHKDIAATLGKSEGYLTRFVVFGDEELQKRWVHSGIVDTAEKLYRVKLLPEHLKLDILRRVALDPSDSDFLEIPLKRSVIDDYGMSSKMEKRRQTKAPAAPATKATPAPAAPAKGKPNSNSGASNPTVPDVHAAAAPAAGATNGPGESHLQAAQAADPAPAILSNTEGYSLSAEDRAKLLVNVGAAVEGPAASATAADRPVAPPVGCKVPLAALEELLPLLRTKPDLLASVRKVVCNIMLPAELAQQLVTVLTGAGADEQELPMLLQNGLADLTEA